MNDSAVWASDGEHRMSSEQARVLSWIGSGGQTGVVGPGSLEVRPTPTPGGEVQILPGAFTIQATPGGSVGYTSAPWQSYVRGLAQTLTVPIRATGSSGGRTDVVGIVIDDPVYEGTAEGMSQDDWDSHQFFRPHVVENAPPGAARPESFANLQRPFLPLARITIPASTATITASMITDIRFIAWSRDWQHPPLLRSVQQGYRISSSETGWRELEQISGIRVPQWATRVKVSGEIIGAAVESGMLRGDVRVRFNAGGSSLVTSDIPWRSPDGGSSRLEIPVAGEIPLQEQHRGREAHMRFLVRANSGTGTLRLSIEEAFYRLNLTFEEAPTIGLS